MIVKVSLTCGGVIVSREIYNGLHATPEQMEDAMKRAVTILTESHTTALGEMFGPDSGVPTCSLGAAPPGEGA